MTDERLEQVIEIFDAAAELSPPARDDYLTATCAGDEELRAEVERLLLRHEQAGDFLEQPILSDAQQSTGELIGRQIGPYKLLRELGSGGMGVVYLAVRADDVYQKEVAVKLVWPGLQRTSLLRRFKQERQILARLDHPHIARLLDGGATEEGWPYVVMEYVDGQPITEYCDAVKLTIDERLRLFGDVCAAVEYAHQNGVIHRDLKPSNILVTKGDVVKLLDFGIAKLLKPDPHAATLTQTGLNLLTPDYASPEQIRDEEITSRSDVYSLGVLLYELLTGVRPYRIKNPLPHEFARIICEVEPASPSHRIAALARAREIFSPDAAGKLRRRLQGDLDKIVLTALAKEPEWRYPSPADFAADIRRHLMGGAIVARGNNPLYRLGKRLRRHKAQTAAAALVLCAAFAAFGWWQITAPARRQAARYEAYAANLERAAAALERARSEDCAQFLQQCLPAPGEPDLRGFEWRYLWDNSHQSLFTLPHPDASVDAHFVVNNERILTESPWATFWLWEAATGRLLDSWRAENGSVSHPEPKTSSEAIVIADETNTFWRKDLRTGQAQRLFTDTLGKISDRTFFPDKQHVAVGHTDGTVSLWTPGAMQPLNILRDAPGIIERVRVAAGGRRMVTQVGTDLLQLWDVSAGLVLATFRERVGSALQFAPDGKHFWTMADGRRLTVRESAAGRTVAVITDAGYRIEGAHLLRDDLFCASGHGALTCYTFPMLKEQFAFTISGTVFLALQLSPDGKLLAASTDDGRLFLWDLASKRSLTGLEGIRGHSAAIWHFNFSADGRKLITAGNDRTAKVWDVASLGPPSTLDAHTDNVMSVAFAPDGRRLASASFDRTIKIWDVTTSTVQRELTGHKDQVLCVTFAPDGQRLASSSSDGTARIWDAATGRLLLTLPHPLQAHMVAFAPDGRTVATACDDEQVRLWDAATGQLLRTLAGHSEPVWAIGFAPDGRTLASGSVDKTVKLWNPATGRELATLTGHEDWVWSTVFSPDGKLLATAGSDHTIKLWDVATRRLLRTLIGHTDEVFEVAFTPDGQRLASASNDDTIKIWDVATGRALLTLTAHQDQVWSVAFSPDGQTLASGSWDKTVRLWRAANQKEIKK